MKKSKNMMEFERAMSEYKGELEDFFVAWKEEQKAIDKVRSMQNDIEHSRIHVTNIYHSLSPAEKKKVK
jgi:hypothetical protein